jgi:hypothetical protein
MAKFLESTFHTLRCIRARRGRAVVLIRGLGSSPSYEKLLELKLCPSKKIASFLPLYAFL